MPDVALYANAMIYRGWTALRVRRSLESPSGAFTVALTERWPGQPTRWAIEPGQACRLELDGETVITGHIDKSERRLDSARHEVQITGRDKAGDLVDCSATLPGERIGSTANLSLTRLALLLCEPYGITVDADVPTGNEFSPAIENGVTVWEALETLARQRGVLIVSDGEGGLVITRAGMTRHPAALVQGENILSAELRRDDSQRFRKYLVRGQRALTGEDDPESAAHVLATATDEAVRAPRLFMFEAEDLADGVSASTRVHFERNIRRARGRRLVVTVPGWSAQGRVWRPNERVQVSLPVWGLEEELLIVTVEHSLDNQGARTALTLSPPDAYELLPEPAKAASAGGELMF